MWYDYSKVLSYNAMFNFIIGERGVGKTYGAKKYAINRFLKKGEQFVYLRRYKTELKEACGDTGKFFGAMYEEFPDQDFKMNGQKIMCGKKVMGYALALSVANILKSTTFNKVSTIIFDEFILDKGSYHYLQNEVEQLLDVVETIARLRDIRVFFLGNAISITNPYFTYFNLSLPYNSDIKTFKDGLIVVNYIKNLHYREVKHKSRFGRLIAGTAYSNYAIDNEFLRDSKTFIKKKSQNAQHYFIFKYHGETYGVWNDWKEGEIFFSKSYDPQCPIIFSVTSDDHDEQSIMLKLRSSVFFKSVIEHYRLSKLFFESQTIKNNVMDLINKHLTY